MSLDLAREVYWLLTYRHTEGLENASIQVGHENRLMDPIHHVFGCKHHTLVHYLRLALQDNGIYIHLEPG